MNTLDAQRLDAGARGPSRTKTLTRTLSAPSSRTILPASCRFDVDLTPNQVEAVLHALEWMMGDEPLSAELYALRDALLKEPT